MYGSKPIIGFKIEIVVEPDNDDFHAYCPALRGLHVGGDTEEEAVQNARDAAIAYLESLIKHNDPIPVGAIMREESEVSGASGGEHINRHTADLQVAYAT